MNRACPVELAQRIRRAADGIRTQTIAWRRDFHQHPELGNQEVRTSRLAAEHLRAVGVDEVHERLAGGTGVLGLIRGAADGPTIGLRADMDALPIRERTGLPFASRAVAPWGDQGRVPVMHACGHDAHTAMLMGAAAVLVKLRRWIRGRVLLIFQPAEESFASDWKGPSGAAAMVEEPAYRARRPDSVFALHIYFSGTPGSAGRVFYRAGRVSYGMSVLRLMVQGKAGHAARPWTGVDAVVIAAQIVLGLQTIISRNVDVYNNHATLSIGTIRGGTKFNVVADSVTLDGALRFTDPAARAALERRVEETAAHIARSAGGRARVRWTAWFPPLVNDPALVEKAVPALKRVLGERRVAPAVTAFGVDDFSYYGERSPALFLRLAADPDELPPGGGVTSLHTPTMTIGERALASGVKALASLALHPALQAPPAAR